MDDKTKIIIFAIISISILEVIALFKNIDGQLFSVVIAVISGLAGYVLPSPIEKNNNK